MKKGLSILCKAAGTFVFAVIVEIIADQLGAGLVQTAKNLLFPASHVEDSSKTDPPIRPATKPDPLPQTQTQAQALPQTQARPLYNPGNKQSRTYDF